MSSLVYSYFCFFMSSLSSYSVWSFLSIDFFSLSIYYLFLAASACKI